ncbi:hypothetical protein JTM76_34320, partial [Pseudomonas aeruginosa]|nr:hypothetical protein [Pseudomonas aeruginosa]
MINGRVQPPTGIVRFECLAHRALWNLPCFQRIDQRKQAESGCFIACFLPGALGVQAIAGLQDLLTL